MLPRVDFRAQDFEDIINEKGYRLNWEQAVLCPCIDPETNHPVADCNLCYGKGRYYINPAEIRGIITRQSKEVQIENVTGILQPGEAYITVSRSNFLSLWDRLTNIDSTIIYNETIAHDSNDGDRLRYAPVGNIQVAVTQTQRKGPLVELQQNVDYIVDATGNITWINSSKQPVDGVYVSFKYLCHPVWIIIQTPSLVRDTFVQFGNPQDTFVQLPIRVIGRLEFFGNQ